MKKHQVLFWGLIVYVLLRIYTSYTVTPDDDDLPSRFQDILLRIAFINPMEGTT